MGATPTAVAIMTAITKARGASPCSFLVVPLVGAFFVDIANAFALPGFIQWLGRGSRARALRTRRATLACRLRVFPRKALFSL
jgi:hypothetical protein